MHVGLSMCFVNLFSFHSIPAKNFYRSSWQTSSAFQCDYSRFYIFCSLTRLIQADSGMRCHQKDVLAECQLGLWAQLTWNWKRKHKNAINLMHPTVRKLVLRMTSENELWQCADFCDRRNFYWDVPFSIKNGEMSWPRLSAVINGKWDYRALIPQHFGMVTSMEMFYTTSERKLWRRNVAKPSIRCQKSLLTILSR